ncbi:hypothetical protein [Longispora albida]|uniref:hypothetical protein n=1 Tax=Longispora albida TaxID=203523 RepID=UPI00035E82D6|nr:hypothetical protein [Longispora albida]
MDRRTLLKTSAAAIAAGAGAVALGSRASAAGTSGWGSPAEYVVHREAGAAIEGIEVTCHGEIYVTSVATGAVYRGRTTDRELRPFLPAGSDGRTAATGIHFDQYGRLFVAGAGTNALYVYDRAGRLLARRTADAEKTFLNDFSFTRDAVYVTDSANQTIWRAPITSERVGQLVPWLTIDAFTPVPQFLNGIVTTPDGRYLLVGEQGADVTYRIDLRTKAVSVVRIADGQVFSGDGFLLEGRRLYGVWNRLSTTGEWEFLTRLVELSPDYATARVVADSRPVSTAVSPTTIARSGRRLLWVNSQLSSPAATPPYLVTEVPGLR